jgi:hypothetical protein
MQPYQEASEAIKRQQDAPSRYLKNAASLGLAATGGGAIASRILPFLNKYVPAEIAKKGLSKISPTISKFINGAINQGYTEEEAFDFIRNKSEGSNKAEVKENRNVIQQYDDRLAAFLDNEIKQGRNPLEAGALARSKKEFQKSIDKIEKDHKTNWSSILSTVYGQPEQSQMQQRSQPQHQPQQKPDVNAQLMAMMQKFSEALKG